MRYILDRDKVILCIKNLGNSVDCKKSADYLEGFHEALDKVIKIIFSLKF